MNKNNYHHPLFSHTIDEVLTSEDIDKFIELHNNYCWDTDAPFKAFLHSESVPFEYEFVDAPPSEDIKLFKPNIAVEWCQHGHDWWEKDVDHTNPDHLFRHLFKKFVQQWKESMECNPQFGMLKLRIYQGSRFFSGYCVPGDICSKAQFVIPVELLVMHEGAWTNIWLTPRQTPMTSDAALSPRASA